MNEIERTLQIEDILKSQNILIDSIISEQMKIREAVKAKDWIELQTGIEIIQHKAAAFVALDKQRDFLSSSASSESLKKTAEAAKQVRSKLLKSKIENKALGNYVSIVHGFVQNILDTVVPQRRNTLYSRKGKIVHAQPESVVVNQLF